MSRLRGCIRVFLRRRLIIADLTLSRVYVSYEIQYFVLESKGGHVYTSPVGVHAFSICVPCEFAYLTALYVPLTYFKMCCCNANHTAGSTVHLVRD